MNRMRDLTNIIELFEMDVEVPYRLNQETYSFSIEYYGEIDGEQEQHGCSLGSLNLIVNGKTGEFKRYAVYDYCKNDYMITSVEWADFLLQHDYLAKNAEFRYTKIATILYELNSREDIRIEDTEFDENEYYKELKMNFEQFEIRYNFNKFNDSQFISLLMAEDSVRLTKQSCKFYDKFMDCVKQHANFSSHFV